MRYKTVIFDFDGTICDTGEGILKSAKFALDYYNIEAPDYTELTYFIGPPLLVTFQEKFGVDAAMADKLVKKYRERYTNKGLLESKLYDGIKELLAKLKAENLKLGIASSKPQDYIEALLDHYGVKSYFDVICGVTFSADCESKANIISRCLKELDTSGNESIMVGDKKYDIEGAKANMIDSVGVLWGYGNRVEFAGAGAKFVAEKIDDIFSIALGYFEQTQEVQGIFSGRIILIFGIAERLRTLRYPIFTGGVVMANGIYSACFLRKRRRCGESPPTQRSKAVRHSPDGLAALIGKDRSGDGNCYFARPSFFSRFHARMTCTLVTRLPGVKAPSPMSGSSPASTAQRAALAVSGSATSL